MKRTADFTTVDRDIKKKYERQLTHYFNQINKIEIKMDGLCKKMCSFSEKRICSELIIEGESATEIADRVFQLIPTMSFRTYITSHRPDNHVPIHDEGMMMFHHQLMTMMFSIDNMKKEAKRKLLALEQGSTFKQTLNEYTMPNINQFTSRTSSSLRDVLQSEQPALSSDQINEIVKSSSVILADELYNAEKNSTAIQQLNGMSFHYECLMREHERMFRAIEDMDSRYQTTVEEKSALIETIKELKNQMASLQKRQQTLSVSVQEQCHENQQLKDQNKKITQNYQALSTRVQAITQENQSLINANTALNQAIENLNDQLQANPKASAISSFFSYGGRTHK